MSVARAHAVRGLARSLRHGGVSATPRVARSARTQLVVARRYASGGGHGHGEPTSDLPWLLGAVGVTIPSVWYLWPTASPDHGHHDSHEKHDDAHEEESKDEEEAADGEEESKDDGKTDSGDGTEGKGDDEKEEKDDKDDDDKKEEKDDDKNDNDKNAENSGDDEDSESATNGKGKTEGVTFKGKTKQGKEDTRKSEPDSKGANKKRIDSGLGKNLGEESQDTKDEDGKSNTESSATAKTAKKGKEGELSSKQFGLSNTPTRHSVEKERLDEISSKGEGTPETAKTMGTVDVNRPAK